MAHPSALSGTRAAGGVNPFHLDAGSARMRPVVALHGEVVIHRDRRMVRELHILVDVFAACQGRQRGRSQVVVNTTKNLHMDRGITGVSDCRDPPERVLV